MEIRIEHLSMTYPSGKQALKDLDLELKAPSLIGLLGPNGAGKSTLMKLLVAALLPTRGEILVDGQPLDRTERLLKARLGYLPQDFGLFDELAVTQFLDYIAGAERDRRSQSGHSESGPSSQSGGKGQGQNPHALRRTAPAGGYCPGDFGGPALPDF